MRKIIAVILCLLFVCSPITVCADAVKTHIATTENNKKILDNIYSYLDENTTVEEQPDGSVVVSLKPVMSSTSDFSATNVYNYNVVNGNVYNSANIQDYTYTTGQTHTPLPLEEKFLYSLLSEEHKDVYRQIDKAVNALASRTEPSAVDLSENSNLFFLYMADNPQHFYLANNVMIYNYGDGTSSFCFYYAIGNQKGEYCGYGYTPSEITEELKQKILAKKSIFDNKVNEFVSTIPVNAPEVIKEYLIYSKILINSYYNLSAKWDGLANDNWTAYGIIANGYGVCESYSEAFQTLCHAVGINCTGVVGTAGGGHKWNAVQIEGEWYQCDITFDDPIGGDPDDAYSYYFNLTDEEMITLNHDWSNCSWDVPRCTATKYSRDNFKLYHSDLEDGVIHCFSCGCDEFCDNCDFKRYASNHKFDNHGFCVDCGVETTDGWVFKGTKWKYNKDGSPIVSDWLKVGVAWYCFDDKGNMVANEWKKDSIGWVYLGSSGAMLTNSWCEDSQGWCYVGADGYAVTNCWKKDSIGRIWLNSNGSMTKNKWIKDDGKWYFLDENGYMASNQWKKDSIGWVYLGSNGAMLTNSWCKDSHGWCYVGADGYAVTNCWKKDSIGWIWLNSNGSMTKSQWLKDGKYWYYLDANGYMVAGKTITIEGKKYTFNSNGVWAS